MPGHFNRTGFVNLQVMVRDIVTDLKSAGFTLLTAYTAAAQGANTAPNHDENTHVYVLAPTTAVDPLAVEEGATTDPNYSRRQPWRLVIQVSHTNHYIRYWACTPTQVITEANGLISVSAYKADATDVRQSGFFGKNNIVSVGPNQKYFFRAFKDANNTVWPSFNGEELDYEALPMSYMLSVTDHGVTLNTWAESYDSSGKCFNWFAIQRLIKEDGSILLDEKSPLFCLFTQNGGGGTDDNTIAPDGILYFVVREEDISAPTIPLSAVVASADSFPLINPIQQVGMMVNRNFVIHFPKGMNTQRYYYPYKLDMIGYASADLLSQKSVQPLTMFGQQRVYEAIQANSPYNKGVRICVMKQGAGIQ